MNSTDEPPVRQTMIGALVEGDHVIVTLECPNCGTVTLEVNIHHVGHLASVFTEVAASLGILVPEPAMRLHPPAPATKGTAH